MQRQLSPAADKPSYVLWPALCQKLTLAMQQNPYLIDHLVSGGVDGHGASQGTAVRALFVGLPSGSPLIADRSSS